MTKATVDLQLKLVDLLTPELDRLANSVPAKVAAMERAMAAKLGDGLDDGAVRGRRPGRTASDLGRFTNLNDQLKSGDVRGDAAKTVTAMRQALEGYLRAGKSGAQAIDGLTEKFGAELTSFVFSTDALARLKSLKKPNFSEAASRSFVNPSVSKALQYSAEIKDYNSGYSMLMAEQAKQARVASEQVKVAAKTLQGFLAQQQQVTGIVASQTELANLLRAEEVQAAERTRLGQMSVRAAVSSLTQQSGVVASQTLLADMLVAEERAANERKVIGQQTVKAAVASLTQQSGVRASQTTLADLLREEVEAEKAALQSRREALQQSKASATLQRAMTAQRLKSADLTDAYTSSVSKSGDDSLPLAERRSAARSIYRMGRQNLVSVLGDEEKANQAIRAARDLEVALTQEIEKERLARKGAAKAAKDHGTAAVQAGQDMVARQKEAHRDIRSDWHDTMRGVTGGMGAIWLSWGQMLPLLTGFALAGGVKAGVGFGAEYEAQINLIKTALVDLNNPAQDLTKEIGALNEEILSLSKQGHDPLDLAKGVKTLTQAGVEGASAKRLLKPTTQLSAVAEMSSEDSALFLANMRGAFGLTDKGTEQAANMMSFVATRSQTSIREIMEGMKQASTVADMYHLKLEDVGVAFMLMAERGIKGSAAGTAFRNMMEDLSGRTSKSQKYLEALGFSMFDASGKIKPFAQLIGELRDKYQGLSDEQKQHLVKMMSTERGMKILVPALEATKEKFEELHAAVRGSGDQDYLGKQYGMVMDGLQKRWEAVKSTFKSGFFEIFRDLEPALKNLFSTFQDFAESDTAKVLGGTLVTALKAVIGVIDLATRTSAIWMTLLAVKGVQSVGSFAQMLGGQAVGAVRSFTSAAQASGGAVNGAGAAVTGLGVTIKSVMVSTIIGIALVAVGALIGKFMELGEASRTAARETAESWAEASKLLAQGKNTAAKQKLVEQRMEAQLSIQAAENDFGSWLNTSTLGKQSYRSHLEGVENRKKAVKGGFLRPEDADRLNRESEASLKERYWSSDPKLKSQIEAKRVQVSELDKKLAYIEQGEKVLGPALIDSGVDRGPTYRLDPSPAGTGAAPSLGSGGRRLGTPNLSIVEGMDLELAKSMTEEAQQQVKLLEDKLQLGEKLGRTYDFQLATQLTEAKLREENLRYEQERLDGLKKIAEYEKKISELKKGIENPNKAGWSAEEVEKARRELGSAEALLAKMNARFRGDGHNPPTLESQHKANLDAIRYSSDAQISAKRFEEFMKPFDREDGVFQVDMKSTNLLKGQRRDDRETLLMRERLAKLTEREIQLEAQYTDEKGEGAEADERRKKLLESLYQAKQEMLDLNDRLNMSDPFARLSDGLDKYLANIRDFSQQGADLMGKFASGVEDAFVDMVQSGKLNMKGLVDSVLADLTRMVVRMTVMEPMMKSMREALSGSGGGGNSGLLSQLVGGLVKVVSGSGTSSTVDAFSSQNGSWTPLDVQSAGVSPILTGKSYLDGGASPMMYAPASGSSLMPNYAPSDSSGTEVVIHNYSGQPAQVSESNAGGQRKVEVVLGDAVAGEMRRPGSSTNKALTQGFGVKPAMTRR